MSDRLEQNKKNAMEFYDMIFNQCKPAEGIDKYVGEKCIQTRNFFRSDIGG